MTLKEDSSQVLFFLHEHLFRYSRSSWPLVLNASVVADGPGGTGVEGVAAGPGGAAVAGGPGGAAVAAGFGADAVIEIEAGCRMSRPWQGRMAAGRRRSGSTTSPAAGARRTRWRRRTSGAAAVLAGDGHPRSSTG